MSIRRVTRACLTNRQKRVVQKDLLPEFPHEPDSTTHCTKSENTFRPTIISYCSLRPSSRTTNSFNSSHGQWPRETPKGRKETAGDVSQDSQFHPPETRSPYKCTSTESFLDHLLDDGEIAFLELVQNTFAGDTYETEGPFPTSDPGGLVSDDALDRWEEWILFVAVDVVSGWQMVIPKEYVRLAEIPWHILLPDDPLCLPKDKVALEGKRVCASTARSSVCMSSASSASEGQVTRRMPCSRRSRGRLRGSTVRGRRPLPPPPPPRPRSSRPRESEGCLVRTGPLSRHSPEGDSPEERARRTARWIMAEFQGDGFLSALEVETKCAICKRTLPSVEEAALHYQSTHVYRRNCPFCCAYMSRDGILGHMRRHYTDLVFR
ncbi:uncharacterized protein LOC122262257 [Penaeus japonicus]|uniref:uncharacterized protein LOC122262257 n=1 Tax=Penaeus japonicus TaxID=27405 RepID=UPI001C710569|nr:uncharacterized protein LOC122262257 [Penaeus japonicus]